MEEYRRRLERTQIKICVLLLVLLFGGLLLLPRIGQIIWIAAIMAIYIRVIHVIARREELLEQRRHETNERSAWYDVHDRRIVISDSKGTWCLEVDSNRDRKATETRRQQLSSPNRRVRLQKRSSHALSQLLGRHRHSWRG
jgi:prepilin signal peptidase PulO-like enzyme (type II secretory pathway)